MNKATLKKTIKKDKKNKSILKTRKENQKPPSDDESINSEYLDELENQKPQISEHSDSEMDETEDNRRLRLAKQILQQTK
jgi:ribosomal RNA-processing protein 9